MLGDEKRKIINFVKRKGDIFVYHKATIDMKMIYALDVLCKYKHIEIKEIKQ